jgi:hypothetical protein
MEKFLLPSAWTGVRQKSGRRSAILAFRDLLNDAEGHDVL